MTDALLRLGTRRLRITSGNWSTLGLRRVSLALLALLACHSEAARLPAEDVAVVRAGSASMDPSPPTPFGSSPSTQASFLARAQSHIAEREYRASHDGSGLQAPNRRHALRTYFEPAGIRVHDRTAPGSPQLLSLSLVGLGRAGALGPVGPGELTSDERRVEIRRPELVEWYENSEAGLEQGFTLASRPAGEGELVLELGVAEASASLRGDRVIFSTQTGRRLAYDKLVVVDATGAEVAARLEVPDEEHLRLVVADAGARYPLTIDPLLSETADAQLDSGQSSARLGTSVAGAGDVNGDGYADVIVGAPRFDAGLSNEGAAFVFLGGASGIDDGDPASAATQLESDQADAELGTSVSSAGDVNGDGYADVIVGAPLYDAGQSNEGAAFLFLGSASGIMDGNPSAAATRLESDQIEARFGSSVSDAGDVDGDGHADVIVGAPLFDAGQSNEGAAFVFLGSATGIADGSAANAAGQIESDQANGELGRSVSGAGDVNGDGYADVIVGAPLFDAGQTNEGAAFVFLGSATGIADGNPANASAQLESNRSNALLGTSVAGAGDVNGDGYADVIVGAPAHANGVLQIDEGAAFVFLGSATGVADGDPTSASAQIESNQSGALLGTSVAGAGDVNGDGYADVIVGAPEYDTGVFQSNAGAAFVFLGGATGVGDGSPTNASMSLESGQSGALLGTSVAGAGDVDGDGYADVIVGARDHNAAQLNEGAAFVFLGGAVGIVDGNPTTAEAQLESDQAASRFGYSVAGAGDVNGDGYADVIVGAQRYDSGQGNAGAAFVFHGSPTGISDGDPLNADAQIDSDQVGSQLGSSVAGAGDVNGDGYADVIVGAPSYVAGQSFEGAAFVFHGSAAGIAGGNPGDANAQLESDQVSASMGSSVSSAGDVNGDGYADVIVGAPHYYAGGLQRGGGAFVFHGSASGIVDGNPTTAATRLVSNEPALGSPFEFPSEFGESVSGAGDVNGDGYADVIVGAPYYENRESDVEEGAAFIYLGSASGIADGDTTTAATRLEADTDLALLGGSVSGAGDVNGDGFADVIVGAHLFQGPGVGDGQEGAAFLFHGSASGVANGTAATAATRLESNQPDAAFGWSVSGAGDVNGDGYADVIVGALNFSGGENEEGAAFVFLGSASGIADGNPGTAPARLDSNQGGSGFGSGVAGAGDVNGDGFADIIVGAMDHPVGAAEGAAFVFLGDDGDARPVMARQLRADGSGTPVEPWGSSVAGEGFEVRMRATNPAGRGRVKLEVEICEAGLAFGDLGCVRQTGPSWIDATATSGGIELAETIEGLEPDTLHRWRARVLYAPYSVTQVGISPPANPGHGPWRRVSGQSNEADLRTVPEPTLALSLALGSVLLTAGRRRMRRIPSRPGESKVRDWAPAGDPWAASVQQ